jgi:ATP adenylyltransferase
MSDADSGRPLWAPWRIEFIRSKKESGCFLCGNEKPEAAKSEEELIVARFPLCFVLLNRYPYNSGHLMVVPYRHVGDIAELSPDEAHELMDACVVAKKVLGSLMFPDAYNIGFNLGLAAGAGVADHLHMHIVPRWNGDTNFMPVLGGCRVVPEALLDTAKLIRAAWPRDTRSGS